MSAAELKEKIGDADLLTREGGPIQITEGQRRQVALFSNGLAAIAIGERWSAEVKMLLTSARKKNYEFTQFIEVETPTILDLYKDSDPESGKAQALELERQVDLADLIRQAGSDRASDIHIRVLKKYTEIRIRVFGRVKDLGSRKSDEGMALIKAAFAVASDLGTNSSDLSFQQGALTAKSNLLPPKVEMVRLQYSPTSDGRGALVMRLKYEAPANEIEIDHLGYNAQQISDISTMRKRTNGMYVLAGKVSSGKSTTLQRVLNKMFVDKHREISMYTIEEPVELDLPGAIQVPVKKNPDGTDGFVEAMKASLRSDPNVIVLGETRSTETAKLAVQAVMTGHALWTTVHAGAALGILDRLTDLGVESWKLEDPTVVRGLVYQRLTGVMCKGCRITFRQGMKNGSLEPELGEKLMNLFAKGPDELYVRGDGCPKCKLGLGGRTVVAETVLTDPKLLELYSKGDRIGMREYWLRPVDDKGLGGVPVLHHALSKVGAGLCDINEVEEEVDLFSIYERDFMFLRPRLLEDVRILEEQEAAKENAKK
ncbi:GspE/PulE family protein [Defluviimonas salinarum]|uniref:ATPase, T2SS/T4P/T4SS family n=1 Tax=Defluviimonas salinarum TaxID=2992147 RepID=A0ABT3J4H8_9RHOB|nr:ATPase, T2SS/T4P/T4SS family [Defluviimonas salinarum]MCW3782573.1 ATPase, T2SS/T4P/T4SS family [Defluviimonas salinarum]